MQWGKRGLRKKRIRSGPGGNDYARGRPAATQLADRAAPSFQLLVGVLVLSFTTYYFAILRAVIATVRKQGWNVLQTLADLDPMQMIRQLRL